jgi:hypothetical protein
MWTETDRSTYRQAGGGLPSDLTDRNGSACNWGRRSPADGRARPTCLGDERDLLSSANRLPVTLFAARDLPAALDGLQHFPDAERDRRNIGLGPSRKVAQLSTRPCPSTKG